jgi:hypothetical protein
MPGASEDVPPALAHRLAFNREPHALQGSVKIGGDRLLMPGDGFEGDEVAGYLKEVHEEALYRVKAVLNRERRRSRV